MADRDCEKTRPWMERMFADSTDDDGNYVQEDQIEIEICPARRLILNEQRRLAEKAATHRSRLASSQSQQTPQSAASHEAKRTPVNEMVMQVTCPVTGMANCKQIVKGLKHQIEASISYDRSVGGAGGGGGRKNQRPQTPNKATPPKQQPKNYCRCATSKINAESSCDCIAPNCPKASKRPPPKNCGKPACTNIYEGYEGDDDEDYDDEYDDEETYVADDDLEKTFNEDFEGKNKKCQCGCVGEGICGNPKCKCGCIKLAPKGSGEDSGRMRGKDSVADKGMQKNVTSSEMSTSTPECVCVAVGDATIPMMVSSKVGASIADRASGHRSGQSGGSASGQQQLCPCQRMCRPLTPQEVTCCVLNAGVFYPCTGPSFCPPPCIMQPQPMRCQPNPCTCCKCKSKPPTSCRPCKQPPSNCNQRCSDASEALSEDSESDDEDQSDP